MAEREPKQPSNGALGVFGQILLCASRFLLCGFFDDLARVKNWIQRVLEDGNINWGVIASDVFGVSGLAILKLITEGVTSANVLAAAVKTKVKRKEESEKTLTNCLTTEHCWLTKEPMTQFGDLGKRIKQADEELVKKNKPYAHLIEEWKNIPGINLSISGIGIGLWSTGWTIE